MRRVIICVSFMLAILQLWPVVFGQSAGAGAASAAAVVTPKPGAGVSQLSVKPVTNIAIGSKSPSLPTCFETYGRRFAQCSGNDSACQLRVIDHWDVCEATGLWPD
ncbi:MAG TPA: hypothetical protein VF637_05900 [Sphingomicrobium sp.]